MQEVLEPRRMLAATAYVNDAGTLIIAGDETDNVIHVDATGTDVVVTLDGVQQTFDPATIKRTSIGGLSGNDNIDIDGRIDSYVEGNAGDDVIRTGGADAVVVGGAGSDRLSLENSPEAVHLMARGGTLFESEAIVRAASYELTIIDRFNRINLTRFDDEAVLGITDILSGDTFADELFLGAGNDSVRGQGSEVNGAIDMIVHGGAGRDIATVEASLQFRFLGGEDDDAVAFNVPTDADSPYAPDGGAGIDLLSLANIPNSPGVSGGTGAIVRLPDSGSFERFFINALNSNGLWARVIVGTDQGEEIEVASGQANPAESLIIEAGGGDDTIIASATNDLTIHGEAGDDVIFGSSGDDRLFGGKGNDVLFGEERTRSALRR
ncbi:MAG: hypothetical protein AAGD32_17920 [Planctomycetota bacterium]